MRFAYHSDGISRQRASAPTVSEQPPYVSIPVSPFRHPTPGPLVALIAVLSAGVTLGAQIPGRNVNMVAGTDVARTAIPFCSARTSRRLRRPRAIRCTWSAAATTTARSTCPGCPNDVRDRRRVAQRLQVVRRRPALVEHAAARLSAGHVAGGLASPLKGYQAAADPVVRAGTNGLIYYSGLVFDRGDRRQERHLPGALHRPQQQGKRRPDRRISAPAWSTTSTGAAVPRQAVDGRGHSARQRPRMCVVGGTPNGATVKRNGHRNAAPATVGATLSGRRADTCAGWRRLRGLHVDHRGRSDAARRRSSSSVRSTAARRGARRCASAAPPTRSTRARRSPSIPQNGDVFVAWRRFASRRGADRRRDHGGAAAGRRQARSTPPGMARGVCGATGRRRQALERDLRAPQEAGAADACVADVVEISTRAPADFSFRTNAYPTMAIDGTGRVYVAWSERGFAAAAARRRSTATRASSSPRPPTAATLHAAGRRRRLERRRSGHQLMPTLAFAGGKLMLVFYDLRETAAQLFEPLRQRPADSDQRQAPDHRHPRRRSARRAPRRRSRRRCACPTT